MNTRELDNLCWSNKWLAPRFGGVYASDKIPMRVHKEITYYIVNADPASQKGSHWMVLRLGGGVVAEFFHILVTFGMYCLLMVQSSSKLGMQCKHQHLHTAANIALCIYTRGSADCR